MTETAVHGFGDATMEIIALGVTYACTAGYETELAPTPANPK
jgi:hypothetical protein